jgi:hypothetical protein
MKLKPYKPGDVSCVAEAVVILRQARYLLDRAGANKAAARVRRALRSADGAMRHVLRRQFRAKMAERTERAA